YFPNALVRARYEDLSNNIYKKPKFFLYFLLNLLLVENVSLKNREMHIHYSSTANDTLNVRNDTVDTKNDTLKVQDDTVNDTVLSIIKHNNQVTAIRISAQLNVSLSTVKRKIKDLKEKGMIERVGSDKTGYWRVIEQ
ncbi:MAG: helix-turn-helix domain-containing protein, partial [Bacteroidales bacterium]|nr:helix-turn-helix domain-containing protein [Bacteroidales bacterium]